MTRRRLLSMLELEDEMAGEWELITDITIEEEQNTLKAIFSKNYSELDVLILDVGSENNAGISNKNATYCFATGGVYNSTRYYFGGVALAQGITKVLHVQCKNKPYRQGNYALINSAANPTGNPTALNGSGTQYINHGGFMTHDDSEAFGGFQFQMQAGILGIGSRMVIYGR